MKTAKRSAAASLIAIMALASSCVTTSEKPVATRRVIDRSPGSDGVPAWAKGPNKFTAADNRVGFKGFLQMDAESRGDACTHAAGTEAKGRIAALIASSVMDESGISGDDKQLVSNRLTAVISKQKIANVEISDEYWNLVEVNDGDKATRRMECWAQVTIPKNVLDKLLDVAMAEVTKDPALARHRERLEEAERHMRDEGASVAH